ncbi:transcriptional regulator PtsJ [Pigmentiphaga aceris]|uniref:Transcriptional regulator PtsJ n=1 Tax=Pigmentiphaga aceris TaxID=1940612 RepID=A0A5C0AWE1_9BURK|nr:transcriptional regulator PtsJ [Pigmentiphaga aceris]QEI06628.1 transcriptional regulator PtsJ [Pigmentiphaga aceris]
MKITGKTALEISDGIRAMVQNGKLKPGDALPPVRDLADTLSVNRNTVAAAYQRLAKAGLALTQGRLGTTICAPPQAGEQEGLSIGTALIDLADGNPDPQWLPNPAELLAGKLAGAFAQQLAGPFLYGDDTILPSLREHAQAWFASDCPAGWTLELTHGAVDAIERLAAAHLVPGDKVAVEDPCFLGSINALRLAGMQTVGVGIDEAGMRPEALAAALDKGARAVLLTPRAHNPTGWGLTPQRAEALKRVLAAHPGVLVIVDDHFALLAETVYCSVIPASTSRWALVRSVSKGLGPDMRLAFVACDIETATRLRTRLAPGMCWVSHILQAIVGVCLGSPDVRRQVDQARDQYASRRQELHAALLAQGIDVPTPTGGFNLWVPVARDPKDVAYALAKKGWLVRVGSAFDVQGQSQAIRVTVSKLQDGQAQRFARDLKMCLG